MGVICSVRFDPVTSLAAAFCTRCSFSISATGKPQNRLLQLSIRGYEGVDQSFSGVTVQILADLAYII